MWLAASTREGEEALILDAWAKAGGNDRALLVIVPRHPQRFDEVARLAERHFRVQRRSEDAPIAAETAKLNLRAAHTMPWEKAIEYERDLQAICFATADAQEGRRARRRRAHHEPFAVRDRDVERGRPFAGTGRQHPRQRDRCRHE